MSDLIDRNELLVRFYYEKDVSSTLWGIDGIENLLLNAPTVEAKPVVHCRDCCFLEVCETSQWLGLDGYCSRGEKHD